MIERGWALGAAALIIYGAFASTHIVDGDNAEFATLGATGGSAHPSGYPLYVLWLRAWSWLPGATPAHTAALATAILGAFTVGVLHAACRAWGARPLAATLAAGIAGAAPIVLRYHCEAEVFALNNLVAALVVWLAADAGPLRGHRRAAALGLVAGLGIANNLTCVLVAPLGLYGVVRAVRESRITACAVAVAGLALGLTPYAYLFVADGPASWGPVTTFSGLISTILREEYGGATSFLPGGALPWQANIAACLATIARSWLWLGALAGIVMLGVRIWRPAGGSRWAWSLLAASFALAGPVLASRFTIEPRGIGLYVCQRFHILPALLLTVPVAVAIDLALEYLRRAGPSRDLAGRAGATRSPAPDHEGALAGQPRQGSDRAEAIAVDPPRPSIPDEDGVAVGQPRDASDHAGATAVDPPRSSIPDEESAAVGQRRDASDHAGATAVEPPSAGGPLSPVAQVGVSGHVLAILGFLALSIIAWPPLSRVHSPALELGVRNLLRSLPPDAIAVVVSEDQCFGGHYLQFARGERPDVAFLCTELFRRDWYRAAWAHRGFALPFSPGPALGDALLRTGRPVFVDPRTAGDLAGFASYPSGVAYRVLPRGESLPSAHDIAVLNRDLYREFALDYDRPHRDDDFAAVAHRRYAGAWAAISRLLDAAGDREGARDAYEVGRSLQPVQD